MAGWVSVVGAGSAPSSASAGLREFRDLARVKAADDRAGSHEDVVTDLKVGQQQRGGASDTAVEVDGRARVVEGQNQARG